MKLAEIFTKCKTQWITAIEQKNHPFRSFVLSTVDINNYPNSRNVILRSFDSNKLNFSIYTDLRSKKVNDLKNSKSVQLLFYDSIDLFQIIVRGELMDKNFDSNIFNVQPEHSKKNYTSKNSPGSIIDNPYNVSVGEEINFCKLTFKALSIETLHLKKELNIRCCFNLSDQWRGFFMTP